jgi:drug/metabolite transporter (DMT)-like permease
MINDHTKLINNDDQIETISTNDRIKIIFLVAGIIIKSAVQGVIIPIIVTDFPSVNFILLATTGQFLCIYGIAYFCLSIKHGFKRLRHKLTIFLSGLFTALMSMCMINSADPQKTPIILQVLLASLPIIPSVFLRKLFLHKTIVYRKKFIVFSFLFLFGSIIVALIPFIGNWKFDNILWTLMYAAGVCFLSAYNVMQERYITETGDDSILNKVTIIFFSRFVELFVIGVYIIFERHLGHMPNEYINIRASFQTLLDKPTTFVLLESFIVAYVLAFMMAIYLNTISTNYNMITPIVANPLIATFFTIFPQFNIGFKYPLWSTITSIILSTIGVIFWIKGEPHNKSYRNKNGYREINNQMNEEQ